MTNIAEAFAWTERDIHIKYDELRTAADGFVAIGISGNEVTLAEQYSRPNLSAHLESLGYAVDPLEALTLQNDVLDGAQSKLDSDEAETEKQISTVLRDAIVANIPDWQDLDAVQIQAVLDDNTFLRIDNELNSYRLILDEAEAMRYLGDYFDKNVIRMEIQQMQYEQKRQQEVPPDKPPFQRVVQIAGIQEVDKG